MIGIVTSPAWNGHALRQFLGEFAPELQQHVKFLDWGDLLRASLRGDSWPYCDPWIFFAIDEHCRKQLLEIETTLRSTLNNVWNAPSKMIGRFELLKKLYAAGINTFDVHSLDSLDEWRWPVFIRARGEQVKPPLLLPDAATARNEIFKQPGLLSLGNMAVEYVDTRGEDGLFRKYSFMRIGDRYIARHLLFSKEWFLKTPDLADQHLADEEMTFVAEASAPLEIVTAFKLAGIEYGRIDFGIDRHGRIQVWEINHSPIVYPMPLIHPHRQPSQWHSAQTIRAALKELCRDPRS